MKTKKAIKINAGVATKYKKVRFDVAKITAMYKAGKPVSQIALSVGYAPNTGNNRVRNTTDESGVVHLMSQSGLWASGMVLGRSRPPSRT
jgi:hypothetical protein